MRGKTVLANGIAVVVGCTLVAAGARVAGVAYAIAVSVTVAMIAALNRTAAQFLAGLVCIRKGQCRVVVVLAARAVCLWIGEPANAVALLVARAKYAARKGAAILANRVVVSIGAAFLAIRAGEAGVAVAGSRTATPAISVAGVAGQAVFARTTVVVRCAAVARRSGPALVARAHPAPGDAFIALAVISTGLAVAVSRTASAIRAIAVLLAAAAFAAVCPLAPELLPAPVAVAVRGDPVCLVARYVTVRVIAVLVLHTVCFTPAAVSSARVAFAGVTLSWAAAGAVVAGPPLCLDGGQRHQ